MSNIIINNTELPTLQGLAINATDDFVVAPTSDPGFSEDIVMSNEDECVSSTSSISHSPSSAQAPDLNSFSIMSDANYDSDTDLASSLEEAIAHKNHDIMAWSKAYRRTLLKIEQNGQLHAHYKMWCEESLKLEEAVQQKTDERDRLVAALNIGQPMASTIITPSASVTTVATPDSKKLTLDSGTPRFGEAKLGKGQTYRVISDPHLFLDSFKTYCENSYGEAPFLASAQRLLCMAILDEQTRQQFNDELTHRGSSSLTWEECEVAFVDSVLTPKERFLTVARVAETGRRPKESYRNFALRLHRSVRVYRIDDGNSTVLTGIMASIPSLELNLIKGAIQKAGTPLSEVKLNSISEILTALSAMEGPDDSVKRQHNLVDDDSDDDQGTSSSKFNKNNSNKRQRRQNHQKSDRRDKNKTTTNSSTASSSSRSDKKMFHCDNHGANRSHDTKDCRHCTKCDKSGHTAPFCKKDSNKNFGNKFGKGRKDKKEDK
ncbi:hypothetical protein BGZ91_003307 [Linnemannia elongata]|nr:hypothetical protein BGZ91_003307 [Linnemannia elongata]